MKNFKICKGVLLYDDQVCFVGLRAIFFRVPALVKCLGNCLQYQLRGMVLTLVSGSTLMGKGLLP